MRLLVVLVFPRRRAINIVQLPKGLQFVFGALSTRMAMTALSGDGILQNVGHVHVKMFVYNAQLVALHGKGLLDRIPQFQLLRRRFVGRLLLLLFLVVVLLYRDTHHGR